MFFEDFGLKATRKSNDNMSRLYTGYKQHVLLHYIQLVLNSGPRGIGTAMQKDGAGDLTQTFIFDLAMQHLEHMRVTV
jgi:hypothetical protein